MVVSVAEAGWSGVTTALIRRDGGCVAAILGAPGMCRDLSGNPLKWDDVRFLQRDHIKCRLMSGRKAPDDTRHLQLVCPWHHHHWIALAVNREKERQRLEELEGPCMSGCWDR